MSQVSSAASSTEVMNGCYRVVKEAARFLKDPHES